MRRFFILDKFNTWYDWRLILTAKDIPDAEVKTNYVNIDGMHGALDLSEALTGEPVYGDRTLAASFSASEGSRDDRERLLRTITTTLHGRKIRLTEPDDPEHYFLGRVQVKNKYNGPAYATFDIEAVCDPWRYAVAESQRSVTVAGNSVGVVIRNEGDKTVCPVITVTGSVVVTFGGVTAELTTGSYKIPDLRLVHGVNVVGVSGTGAVTFTYTEASL